MPYPHQLRLAAVEKIDAVIKIPGSKSITNRAFVIAALANGQSTLCGPLHSDDTIAMMGCLRNFGVQIETVESGDVIVTGVSGQLHSSDESLFVNNSGTTIRFLTGAAALTPAGSSTILDGIARMRQRPIQDLVTSLHQLGVHAETSSNGCPPVTVRGGGIPGGKCTVNGAISSQYLSALLLSAPYALEDVQIEVDGELVSKPYIDITLSMMSAFGVTVANSDHRSYTVPARQFYSARTYAIEPDASNASYFFAAAAITGGKVTVNGLGTTSIQGDIGVLDVFEKMGCKIDRTTTSYTLVGPAVLAAVDIDAKAIPDMAQTIAVAACFASGTSRISGLDNLRVKETDRIAAMATELRKTGAFVTEGSDYLVITPTKSPTAASIDTYEDHRMAMSFAIAGLKIDGLTINDPGCVAKTFPDFWDRWRTAFPGSTVGED